MVGNFVHGLGEKLVSGEVNPHTFTLDRPKGTYSGAPELKRIARKLHRNACLLEKELGGPQDIEWALHAHVHSHQAPSVSAGQVTSSCNEVIKRRCSP